MALEEEPIKWGMIKYDGPLPKNFYRYRKITPENIDRVIDFEIGEEGIYLAGMKDLNDPVEGRFVFKFDGTKKAIFKYWRKVVRKLFPHYSRKDAIEEAWRRTNITTGNGGYVPDAWIENIRMMTDHCIRVACFTLDPLNNAMWSHYGQYHAGVQAGMGSIEHGGICIHYESDEGWRDTNLYPVSYSNSIPIINGLSVEESPRDLVSALYQKTEEWSYEKEWRIVATINVQPPYPDNIGANSKIAMKDGVKSIIFGLNTPSATVQYFRDRLLGYERKIVFRKVCRSLTTSELEIVGI